MVFHIVVMPPVSLALGEFLPNREALLKVLNRLYDQMENNAARYRSRRDPEDPDLFDYVLYLADGNDAWHTFRFSVDDRQATGYLFVVGVSHRPGKVRM
jgi:hypothetical protein